MCDFAGGIFGLFGVLGASEDRVGVGVYLD